MAEMASHTVTLMVVLFVFSASVKSKSTGESSAGHANSLTLGKLAIETRSNVKPDVRLFFRPDKSTLPPVVSTAAWKHPSSTDEEQKEAGSAEKILGGSHRTNEIVRRGSFAGDNQNEKEKTPTETSIVQRIASQKLAINKSIADTTASFKVSGRNRGKGRPSTILQSGKNRPEWGDLNSAPSYPHQDDVDDETAKETSNVDATGENDGVEYDDDNDSDVDDDDDADYDAVDEDYEDDDDFQYYGDSTTVSGQEKEEEKEDEGEKEIDDEKQLSSKESVGREGIQYHEYEVSAESSRELDTTNAEVINEVRIVDQPVRRRRLKGRPRTPEKTRSKSRKRRRKRPPIEPVGPVKKPTRTRRPTGAGSRRRKTKGRRRRKDQSGSGRKTRRKNRRRNKLTTSLGLGLSGAGTGNENNFRRPEVDASTKPRLQQTSAIIQHLLPQQQQYQQQQLGDSPYYIPRYVDVHDGQDRRRIVAATADVRGPSSSQQASAAHRTDYSRVSGRVPPIDHGATATQQKPRTTASQGRPQATALQGHYFDPRQYHQLAQHHPHHQYFQQYYEQQRPPPHHHQQQHPRQFYQSYYQQQASPTYSRHQQQVHFIVPTSDIDVAQIQQVMSALGLDHISAGQQQQSAAGQAHLQSQFAANRHQSSHFGAYREALPDNLLAATSEDEQQQQQQQREELSLSGSGLTSSADTVKRVRRQSSMIERRTADEDDEEKTERQRPAAAGSIHDISEDVSDDFNADSDDEEYVDNSDIEITTRGPGPPTTAPY